MKFKLYINCFINGFFYTRTKLRDDHFNFKYNCNYYDMVSDYMIPYRDFYINSPRSSFGYNFSNHEI